MWNSVSPGAAMDGAWRRGHDFAVIAGNAGDEPQAGNDSPALDVLFNMGLAVSFFNFGKFIRRPVPQKVEIMMYLCGCYPDASLALNAAARSGCVVEGIAKGVDFRTPTGT